MLPRPAVTQRRSLTPTPRQRPERALSGPATRRHRNAGDRRMNWRPENGRKTRERQRAIHRRPSGMRLQQNREPQGARCQQSG